MTKLEKDDFVKTGKITPIRVNFNSKTGKYSVLAKFYYGKIHEAKWVPLSQMKKDERDHFWVTKWYAENVLKWEVINTEVNYL